MITEQIHKRSSVIYIYCELLTISWSTWEGESLGRGSFTVMEKETVQCVWHCLGRQSASGVWWRVWALGMQRRSTGPPEIRALREKTPSGLKWPPIRRNWIVQKPYFTIVPRGSSHLGDPKGLTPCLEMASFQCLLIKYLDEAILTINSRVPVLSLLLFRWNTPQIMSFLTVLPPSFLLKVYHMLFQATHFPHLIILAYTTALRSIPPTCTRRISTLGKELGKNMTCSIMPNQKLPKLKTKQNSSLSPERQMRSDLLSFPPVSHSTSGTPIPLSVIPLH